MINIPTFDNLYTPLLLDVPILKITPTILFAQVVDKSGLAYRKTKKNVQISTFSPKA